MKKIGLIAIGLALLPFQAFAEDLSPADCLVLESMIDLPQSTVTQKGSEFGTSAYARATNKNETPEQELERRKQEYAVRERQRQVERTQLQQQSSAAELADRQIQANLSHLKDMFAQASCEDKIKSIQDQMGCLALDLTIAQLDPVSYGKQLDSLKANSSKTPGIQKVETAIEKELRELAANNAFEEEKLNQERIAEYNKVEARALRDQLQVKSRMKLLKDTAKSNCKDQFSALPQKLKLK